MFLQKPKAIYYTKKIVSKFQGKKIDLVSSFLKENNNEIKILIRVDDFPHWKHSLEKFKKFHHLMYKYKIMYLLGVIPQPSLDPLKTKNMKTRNLTDEEKNYIKNLKDEGVEIGMHGFSHQNYHSRIKSELIGRKQEDLKYEIERGLSIFKNIEIEPRIFIPPYNTLNLNTIKLLSKYFKLITGGEESIRFIGYYWGLVNFKNIFYLPSYPPLYEKSESICNFIENKGFKTSFLLPVTLHWSWELEDNFKGLEKLLSRIKATIITWDKIFE